MNIFLKCSIVAALFLLAALVQANFLSHLTVMGIAPDLVFVIFFTLIFFEPSSHKASTGHRKSNRYYEGVFYTVAAGLILDLYSVQPFGMALASLLAIYIITKISSYFLKENRHQFPVFYFVPVFLLALVLYTGIFELLTNFRYATFFVDKSTTISGLYNAGFALAAFYLYPARAPKQLKLL